MNSEIKRMLGEIIEILEHNKIEIPEELVQVNGVLERAIVSGDPVSEDDLNVIGHWLMPEFGSGWYESLETQLPPDQFFQLNSWIKQLFKSMAKIS